MPQPVTSSVPGFQYDVFVSYANAINHDGWVTRFQESLINFLNERLQAPPSVFFDEQSIRLNDTLDTLIRDSVRHAAVMVVVMSHKYLMRQWCTMEREEFLRNGDTQRVMVVRYDDVPYQELQKVFPQVLGIEFFDDDGLPLETDSHEFKKRMHKLRMTIIEELDRLRRGEQRAAQREEVTNSDRPEPRGPEGGTGGTSGTDRPLVYLAPVRPTVEMIGRLDELTSFLDDCEIATLKPEDYFFTRPEFASEVAGNVGRCDGFVQLLDARPIPSPDMIAGGMERWFLDQARQHNHLAILRWRSGEPSADNSDFHDMALDADVRPFEFARFCELVRDEARSRSQARRAAARLANTTTPPLLVLRADSDDEAYGGEIARRLEDQGLDLMEVPASVIDSLEDVASQLPAGGILVVHRRSRSVLQQIQELRAFTVKEAARHWVLGFWNSPEDPKRGVLPRMLKNVHVINQGDTAALEAFVAELQCRGSLA